VLRHDSDTVDYNQADALELYQKSKTIVKVRSGVLPQLLRQKTVAHAMHSQEMAGNIRLRFQFVA